MSNEQEITLEFSVKVKYTLKAGEVFCQQSAQENLQTVIDNARQEFLLTPAGIDASCVEVKIADNKQVSTDANLLEPSEYAILLNDMYYLERFNEDNHPDGHCVMSRDSETALRFENAKWAEDTIKEEPELQGAVVVAIS